MFFQPGTTVNFYWTRSPNDSMPDSMPYRIDVPPGEAPDFRLRITNATTNDHLHVGATWSKPFDTLSQ